MQNDCGTRHNSGGRQPPPVGKLAREPSPDSVLQRAEELADIKDKPPTPTKLAPPEKKIVKPKAVEGSQNPTVPTPEMVEQFEPMLRAKEGFERRADVKLACTLFVGYHIAIVCCCLKDSSTLSALVWKVATVLATVFYTDLFTGKLHIYLDHRRCDVGDPLDMAAYSFRYDHHAYPNNFFKFSALFPSGAANILTSITAPLTLVWHLALWYYGGMYHQVPTDSTLELKLIAACTFIAGGSLCQTTHALAHEGRQKRNDTFPTIIAALQRWHLILPPKTHGGHHKDEHDKNFCILNGWANPLLNSLRHHVFAAMRQCPSHFDILAVPGPNSWAAQQKRKAE